MGHQNVVPEGTTSVRGQPKDVYRVMPADGEPLRPYPIEPIIPATA